MKILYIITRLDRGGSAEAVMQWAAGMRSSGHIVKLITGRTSQPHQNLKSYSRVMDVPVIGVDLLQRELHPFLDFIAFIRLYKIIKFEHPDVVHTNSSKAGILGRLAARLAKVPVIVHSPHGHIFYGYYGRLKTGVFIFLERMAARFCDRITNLTRLGMEDHIRLRIAPREKFMVIPPGIDIDRYAHPKRNRRIVRQELNIEPDSIVVGWVGRLDRVKNPLLFLEAADLLKKVARLKFLVVGDGELMKEAEQFVQVRGLVGVVTFTGFRSDVPELLAAMDIYCLTSLNEGLGRSILEAQSAGVPVIASRVGGVPEIVIDGETGMLFPAGDAKTLAEKIKLLAEEPQIRTMLKKAALKTINEFSLQKTLDDIDNLYGELLSLKGRLPLRDFG